MNEKVAIVTGAARGIGLATVRELLVSGWRVALVDRDQPALSQSYSELDKTNECAADDVLLAISCDVSVCEDVKHMVDTTPVSYTHLTLPTKRIV